MICEITRANGLATTATDDSLVASGQTTVRDLQQRTWLLQTRNSAYCIAVCDQNAATEPVQAPLSQLVRLYWGPRLARVEDYLQSVEFPERSSFDDAPLVWPHEYRPWHGRMYQEPSLKVAFLDGTRDVAWRFQGAELTSLHHDQQGGAASEANLLILHFSDSKGLDISLYYQTLHDEDVVTRWVEVTNTSPDVVKVTQLASAVWNPPMLPSYRATTVYGDWGREFQLQRSFLPHGKYVAESRKGHTGHQANPFFMLDEGGATENVGSVWFGALAWSGNWIITFEQNGHGQLSISGGYHDFDFVRILDSGDKVTSPHFYAGYSEFGFGGASARMHRLAHRIQAQYGTLERPTPVLYNSWEATYFDINERDQMKLAQRAAQLGVELFVVDDGWFGMRNSDSSGLGDWTVNPEKFPNGLDPLIHYVEQLGMRFGIWVEPEMVNPDSELYRAHADWVLSFPGRSKTLARNQLLVDFSNSEAREFIFKQLDALLTRHHIGFMKWDMNRPLTEPGSPVLSTEGQSEVWARHVEGVYEILGRLHERHPQVVFESCSGGGGRVDFAMLRFASQFWTSDNTDAFDRLRIQEGFSYGYPASTMRAWVTDSPQFMNARQVPLVFRFHSAMMGALGIGVDITKWTPDECAQAHKQVSIYKSIRHLITDGNLHRLISPTFGTRLAGEARSGAADGDWTAVEYVSADGTQAVVFVLTRGTQYGDLTPVIHPVGLRTDAVYRLELVDFHAADDERVRQWLDAMPRSGLAWSKIGFQLRLRGDYASAILRFRRVSESQTEQI